MDNNTEKATLKAGGFQAIETKYLGPTDHKGARYKATAQAGSVTISQDYSLNYEKNHAKAAQAYADKMGWTGNYVGGATKTGYVFVYVAGLGGE